MSRSSSRIAVVGRGALATRVHQAARDLGIPTAAVAPGPHVDVVGAAIAAGCEAIHPAGGSLVARLALARHAHWAGLACVGPPLDVLTRLADPRTLRGLATGAGLAPLPDAAPGLATEPGLAPLPADSRLLPADSRWWHGVAATVGYPLRCCDRSGAGPIVTTASGLFAAVRAARCASASGEVFLRSARPLARADVPVLGDGRTAIALPGSAPAAVARAASTLARVAGYVGAATVVVARDGSGAWRLDRVLPHLRGDGATLDALRAEIAVFLGGRIERTRSGFVVHGADTHPAVGR